MTSGPDRDDPESNVLKLDVPFTGAPCVGRLVEWDSDAGPRVDFPGNDAGPRPARTTVAIDATLAHEAIRTARGVVLLFDGGKHDRPIIVGLLQEPNLEPKVERVEVDGERVEIRGDKEIVFRCGEASIVLRRNGRVVIRGTQVETRARGTNRIKGGSVQIN